MSSFDLNDELLYKAKYLKYKNKYINLKGGQVQKLDVHFYAHALLEEESSPFIGNNIDNVIQHLTNILQYSDKIIILNYILFQIKLNHKIKMNKYDLSNLKWMYNKKNFLKCTK
jgi:hypothetical protein